MNNIIETKNRALGELYAWCRELMDGRNDYNQDQAYEEDRFCITRDVCN